MGESHGRDGEGVAGEERGAPEGVGQLEYWNNGTKDGDREMKREIMTDEEILLEAMEKRITELQVATEILRDLQNRNAWGSVSYTHLAFCLCGWRLGGCILHPFCWHCRFCCC